MNIPFKRQPTNLDLLIEDVEAMLCHRNPGSDEYDDLLEQYKDLMEMRKKNKRAPIDPNVLLTVAANIAGILVVAKAERLSALSSKIWGILMRPRSS